MKKRSLMRYDKVFVQNKRKSLIKNRISKILDRVPSFYTQIE